MTKKPLVSMPILKHSLTYVMGVLSMWKIRSIPQKAPAGIMKSQTVMMPRIKCADCGKVWVDVGDYKKNPGCDKPLCKNTEDAVMSRRRHNYRNMTIDPPDEPVAALETKNKAHIHTHTTTGPVLSEWDKTLEVETLIVYNAININIFPR